MMKRILITGGKGQLGSCLRRLLDARADIVADYTDVDGGCGCSMLDLTDGAGVAAKVNSFRPGYIVNCAAYTAVDKAESEAGLCRKVNTDAVRNIALAASGAGAKVIHISTDYVFGGDADTPYTEDAPTSPCNVYGITKLEGERELLRIMPEQSVILRTAWLYSVYGNNFVKTMLRLGSEREALGVVADQFGSPTYAPVLAQAVMSVIDSDRWCPGIYHLSGSGQTSWYDFARAIFNMQGIKCALSPLDTGQYPTAAAGPRYTVLDTSKFRNTFGVEIPCWQESLACFFDDYASITRS